MPNLCRRARKSPSSSFNSSPLSSTHQHERRNFSAEIGYLTDFFKRVTQTTTSTVSTTVRTLTSPLRYTRRGDTTSTPAHFNATIQQQHQLNDDHEQAAAGYYEYFRNAMFSTIQRGRGVFGSAPQPHRTIILTPGSPASLTRSTTPKRVTFKECKIIYLFLSLRRRKIPLRRKSFCVLMSVNYLVYEGAFLFFIILFN